MWLRNALMWSTATPLEAKQLSRLPANFLSRCPLTFFKCLHKTTRVSHSHARFTAASWQFGGSECGKQTRQACRTDCQLTSPLTVHTGCTTYMLCQHTRPDDESPPLEVIRDGGLHVHAGLQQALPHVLAQVAPVHGLAGLPRNDLACIKGTRLEVLLQSLHAQGSTIHARQHLGCCSMHAQIWTGMPGIGGMRGVRALQAAHRVDSGAANHLSAMQTTCERAEQKQEGTSSLIGCSTSLCGSNVKYLTKC